MAVARVVRAVVAAAEGLPQQADLLPQAVHLQQFPAHKHLLLVGKADRVVRGVEAPPRRKVDRRLLRRASSYWYSKVRL